MTQKQKQLDHLSVSDLVSAIQAESNDLEKVAQIELENGNEGAAMIYGFAAHKLKKIIEAHQHG